MDELDRTYFCASCVGPGRRRMEATISRSKTRGDDAWEETNDDRTSQQYDSARTRMTYLLVEENLVLNVPRQIRGDLGT